MRRQNISGGSRFEDVIGYSRIVVMGDDVHVSGVAGFDYAAGTISDDVAEQTEQVFRNLEAYLAKAGVGLSDVYRTLVIVSDRNEWQTVVEVIGRHFRPVRPTCTAFVADLVDPRMKVEIEVSARRAETIVNPP